MRLAGERPSWNDLLERVFRVDRFARPGCGGPLTLRGMVLNPRATPLDMMRVAAAVQHLVNGETPAPPECRW